MLFDVINILVAHHAQLHVYLGQPFYQLHWCKMAENYNEAWSAWLEDQPENPNVELLQALQGLQYKEPACNTILEMIRKKVYPKNKIFYHILERWIINLNKMVDTGVLTWVSPREKSDDPCNTGKLPDSQYRGRTSSRHLPSTLRPSPIILRRITWHFQKLKNWQT